MGKKKNQKKKAHKTVQKQKLAMTPQQLISKGAENLAAGRCREAVEDLKLAIKTGGAQDKISPLLFRAYLVRADQLRRKSLFVEAEALVKQAELHLPPAENLSEEDFLLYLSSSPVDEGFRIYARHARSTGRLPEAEQLLANRLLLDGGWNSLEGLDEENPLRKDAAHVRSALPPMNEGDWEAAVDSLRPLARSSPFAQLRLFCRGMAAFYRNDLPEMEKAFSLISENFPLSPLARQMQMLPSSVGCLWEGPAGLEDEASKLAEAVKRNRWEEVRKMIAGLSEKLYPPSPEAMRTALLKRICGYFHENRISPFACADLAGRLLPRKKSEYLLAQMAFARNITGSLATSGLLIDFLDVGFPEPAQRNMAHSLILRETVRRILRRENRLAGSIGDIASYGKALGIESENHRMIPVDMALKAIRLDPENREGYELLAELPRCHREAKSKVEKGLLEMSRLFAEDPFPWLELARLHSEKRAFRKAQAALEEAMKRAPHDSRIVDQNVLTLLSSAQNNMRRKKLHLVAADIERAEKLGSRAAALFVTEKRMLFETVFQRRNLALIIGTRTGALPLGDRLRILALLSKDMGLLSFPFKNVLLDALNRFIEESLRRSGALSSADMVRVLKPLEPGLDAVYPFRQVATVFSGRLKDVLRIVDDSGVLTVFDQILGVETYELIRKEIRKRLKKADPRHSILMRFYLAAVEQLVSGAYDGGNFSEIVGQAKGPLLEELRAVSRSLSAHAYGSLRRALDTFRFDVFSPEETEELSEDEDDDPFFFEDEDEGEAGFDFEDADAFLEFANPFPGDMEGGFGGHFGENKKMMIAAIEKWVDEMGLRGAPDRMIRELRGEIRASPKDRKGLDGIGALAKCVSFSDLSREARILLTGKP